ncbi:MAG: ADP-ribosylglycohydrolase family protein [Gemmatimonadales bacterium]
MEPRTPDRARGTDRLLGALIGLAVGDALGTTVEFRAPGTFPPVTTITGGGPFRLAPGQWTDDTSMALCLADSLIECGGFDPADQMERYWRWYRGGYRSSTGRCFDIGTTVREALDRYRETGNPFAGSTDPQTAGNGSLMRLAPIVLYSAARPREAVRLAAESSRTTHGAATAVDACRALAALLLGTLRGLPKDELLDSDRLLGLGFWNEQPLEPAVAAVLAGSYRAKAPPEIKGTGYVVDSLEAALWAFDRTDTFEAGALAAVNLGNDSDTTGAVYGQLAGAYYGLAGVPSLWLEVLHGREELLALGRRLIDRQAPAPGPRS